MGSSRKVTELFIDNVEKRKCLYDIKCDTFKDRFFKERVWKEVAEEMGETDVNLMKMKWKNLKDSYIKFRRANFSNSRKVRQYKNWTWGQRLSFLAPFVKTKRKLQEHKKVEFRKKVIPKKPLVINLRKQVKEEIISSSDTELADAFADTENMEEENNKDNNPLQDQNLDLLKILDEPELQVNVEKSKRLLKQVVKVDQTNLNDYNSTQRSSTSSSQDNDGDHSLYRGEQEDDVYYLFRSYAETFRRLAPRRRILLKLVLAKLFLNAEMEQFEETNNLKIIRNSSNSHNGLDS